MATITLRSVKGTPLTNTEIDDNFSNINTELSQKLNLSGGSLTGNLDFNGTGLRITGDMSNSTQLNRLLFQSSTLNGNTAVGAIPNGTSQISSFIAFNNADPTNASFIQIQATSSEVRLNSSITGTGTPLPLVLYTAGNETIRFDTNRNIGIGGTASARNRVRIGGVMSSSGGETFGVMLDGVIPSSTTTDAIGYMGYYSTAAESFTLARLHHFWAGSSGIGAGSTLTNQYGFHADSSLSGATNNFGFYSNLNSGTNRWNFYANGTADNYFAGNLGIGTPTPISKFDVYTASGSVSSYVRSAGSTGTDIARSYTQAGTTTVQSIAYGSGIAQLLASASFAFTIGNSQNAPVTILVNNAERIRFDTSGRAGLGTTNPTEKFQVNDGNILIRNVSSNPHLYFENTFSYIRRATATNNLEINAQAGANILLGTGGTEYARINTSGLSTTFAINLDYTNFTVGRLSAGESDFYVSSVDAANLYLSTNANLHLRTNNVTRLMLSAAGALSIGLSNFGNSGQVLTSAGASNPPTWTTVSGSPTINIVTATTQTAVANNHYVLTNAAVSTVSLPSAPASGDMVWITVGNNRADNIIARNGQNIMGLAEDMIIDSVNATVQLRFVNSTLGWRLL